MKILIIEDEKNMSQLLALELTHASYTCEQAYDGEQGLAMALNNEYDVILLDLMLPRMNGIEVCRRLREQKQTPVIMLTARDSVMDKVNGLQIGADDYVPKPFAMEELLARIQAVLRRGNRQTMVLQHGDMTLHVDTRRVHQKEEEIALTATEFELLKVLMQEVGNVVHKETILQEVWGYETEVETNVVEVYIRYLRNKVKGIQIETVRGVGYRLV